MKTISFEITEITDRRNGYNMPVIKVKSPANLTIINRGYNEFACLQDIDESSLLPLREYFPGDDWAMLEISTPERDTNCWYYLKGAYNTNNIRW